MRRFILICAVLFAGLGEASAAAPAYGVLREAAGLVQVRAEGGDRWKPAGRLPRPLAAGDSVRTGFNARAVIAFAGGAVLTAAGNTQIALDDAVRGGAVIDLVFGSVRVGARSLSGRPLELRTPTAVSRARSEGAAWRAAVGGGGGAVFEVEDGLIAVEDSRGGALRLREGERVEVDLAGLHEPAPTPTPTKARRDGFAESMRRELALDREVDEAQRRVSNEIRQEAYELGEVQTNAAGDEVRVEQYVVRLSPTSFEFVSMNESRGNGLSWYSWTGTFGSALPTNLAQVFDILPGSAGAAAPWTLTGYRAVSSNGVDSLVEAATGGHQVNLNDNSYPADAVTTLYNPSTDLYQNVAGQAVYKVLFDGYGLYSDGVLKYGYTGSNIQSPTQGITPSTTNDPLTGAALAVPLGSYTTNTTFPNPGAVSQVSYTSYLDGNGNGTYLSVDDRAVSPGGGVVSQSAFGFSTSGTSFGTGLLRSVFEQTTTASEFGGRSIDVLVSPRILIETGGLP